VSKKSAAIATRIQQFEGAMLPAHYLGFFDCFNRQQYYEAHDVLEEMWLSAKRGADGDFYKGLIQLAGAFVHVQKNRPGPAVALLDLARNNLQKYPTVHHSLDIKPVLGLICLWRERLVGVHTTVGMLERAGGPVLSLLK
jgi:predicted metal-dependent hydrolase